MTRPRAREAGIWFGELPTGPKNMITDVPGVRVGHCTVIRGAGPLRPGEGPVRTGVTAILPHTRNLFREPVKGAYFDMNGCGGLGGALQIREFGLIETPILLTNTMSMGAVSEGIIRYMLRSNPEIGRDADTIIPIVSECDDSFLNDSQGLHVRAEHAIAAIEDAKPTVVEGAVGAGTGMTCYDFKGGIGTSSRVVSLESGKFTLGVLVLSNHGDRTQLRIDGVPVGALLPAPPRKRQESGSIVMVVGTDAPLDARQLGRVARRTAMGLAQTGSCSHNGSGDIAIAFSTANVHDRTREKGLVTERLLQDKDMDPLFQATADATAEAIINSLFKAETVEGRDGNTSFALPIDQTLEILRAHNRLRL
ncbi:MAG: P1 family peptidase [Thermoplasmata archaeon]